MPEQQWFERWFNSPYYHVLYQNRDKQEAERFIDALLGFLNPPPDSKVMDLACGKGRHARYLANKGHHVWGTDLASDSIAVAKEFETEQLHFAVHDMREPFSESGFDYVFNFFTSFGYFNSSFDNVRTLKSAHQMLKPNGTLVIDFMNAHKVIQNLVLSETKTVNGIEFRITRMVEGEDERFIVKRIAFEDDGEQYHFEERVQAFELEAFKTFFELSGFRLVNTFGDYQLNPFEAKTSDRLILLARANA